MKITETDIIQHHSKEYPMEIGAPSFAPVAIKEIKDVALNSAKLAAQKEYERIMESVQVLQKQANELLLRMEMTELVHEAEYSFEPVPGKEYWLILDLRKEKHILSMLSPSDWSCGPPDHYQYKNKLKCLGDKTWEVSIK